MSLAHKQTARQSHCKVFPENRFRTISFTGIFKLHPWEGFLFTDVRDSETLQNKRRTASRRACPLWLLVRDLK